MGGMLDGNDLEPSGDPLSYSLEQAAALLDISVQTVRRRASRDDDPLCAAPGFSNPIRVSHTSVQTARAALAKKLKMYLEPPVSCSHPSIDELTRENERLRRLVLTLRVSGMQLLENVGDFADPLLPNT
jgi:hypothetical protein